MPAWELGVRTGTRAESTALSLTADHKGTLFFVTDEDVMERWSGSAWVQVGINSAPASGRPTARAKRTSGYITLSSTTWANVDTGLDLTIAAEEGDVLAVSLAGLLGAASGQGCGIDVVTVVSGSPVNSLSGQNGAGDYGWLYTGVAEAGLTGTIQYPVVAGDISGGNVILRLRYRQSSTTNRLFYAGTGGDPMFNWSVVNLGQV